MRIGIDLGGTKTEIIALDPSGRELFRKRVPTPSHSYDEIVANIATLVLSTEAELESKATVGIGMPGALSPATGRIKNANTTCLIDRPLDKDLESLLQRPIRLANDANCFALSEAVDGSASQARAVFGVILGTGVGGGIVVDRKLLVGPNAIAGEWGHNPLPWPEEDERPGPDCYCGKKGCIETYLSGPGLERSHFISGREKISAAEISLRAESGDPTAETTLARFEDRLARSLATVVNILDPDAIVLGGGLSNLKRLYVNVPKLLSKYVFSDRVDSRLVSAHHGDSSGVRGAAWLWPN